MIFKVKNVYPFSKNDQESLRSAMSWSSNIWSSLWACWSSHLLGVADDVAGTFGDTSFLWNCGSSGVEVHESEGDVSVVLKSLNFSNFVVVSRNSQVSIVNVFNLVVFDVDWLSSELIVLSSLSGSCSWSNGIESTNWCIEIISDLLVDISSLIIWNELINNWENWLSISGWGVQELVDVCVSWGTDLLSGWSINWFINWLWSWSNIYWFWCCLFVVSSETPEFLHHFCLYFKY